MEGTSSHTEHVVVPSIGSSSQHSYRCPQCTQGEQIGRNLIVGIDGTSNEFGRENTNVVKLLSKIDRKKTSGEAEQQSYYISGIGTRPKLSHREDQSVSDALDLAVARSIGENVVDAYGWLAQTYRKGDVLYLFGFSRGAYQVRMLAEMVHEVGLVLTPTKSEIIRAYGRYEAIHLGRPKAKEKAKEFKTSFSREGLRVHFVGLWDTVSSEGFIRRDTFISPVGHACHFRHALALDERRVKFLPEYLHNVNAPTDDVKSKYIDSPIDVQLFASPEGQRRESPARSVASEGKKLTEIKEVWFAGSHSDVGGVERAGKFNHAGSVSLLWMRREAAENGLVLKPIDMCWSPDDLDFGTSSSMTGLWETVELIPIKHQVSYSGTGESVWRPHRWRPRRIIPGQKIHASILYANAYRPKATLQNGFNIPLEDSGLNDEMWERRLFDDTAAQELVNGLGTRQGAAPIYLDKLLFMLRFEEGKQCVRNVPDWKDGFLKLINNSECTPLVRLIAIIAYYEASWDTEVHSTSHVPPHDPLLQNNFDEAKGWMTEVLAVQKHQDVPRVVALLRPLTKHQDLRKRILTEDASEKLISLFDRTISQQRNFAHAMDVLNCLLQCEDTRETIAKQLGGRYLNSNVSRLSRMLVVEDPYLLTAALRMMLTLARIPYGRTVCSVVKPRLQLLASSTVQKRILLSSPGSESTSRIKEFTRGDDQSVGVLAVEVLLALYEPNDWKKWYIENTHVRTNLASALLRLKLDRCDFPDRQGLSIDRGQEILRRFFGLNSTVLHDLQKKLISEMIQAVKTGNFRERFISTMALLKLCESNATTIHTFLCETKLLDVFISQLQRKDTALLAAYALAICLRYSDMKDSIKDNEDLPKHIVRMLRLDYFDDAVGLVEGFQIFATLMQHADIREEIQKHDITEVLKTKLMKQKPKEIRTSLICLDIFWSFDSKSTWTSKLVQKGLGHLQNSEWKVQKAGITILASLAQMEQGVNVIKLCIPQIIKMLLPEDPSVPAPVQPSVPQATQSGSTLPSEGKAASNGSTRHRRMTALRLRLLRSVTIAQPPSSQDVLPRTPSQLMGPACALHILAQNEALRECTRNAPEYGNLKRLYISETLISERDTSPWHVKTPNRSDVIIILDKMIKTVDGEPSGEDLMSIENVELPHIAHWKRLTKVLSARAIMGIAFLPLRYGIIALVIPVMVTIYPILLPYFIFLIVSRTWSADKQDPLFGCIVTSDLDSPERASAPGGHDTDEGPSSDHGGEGSQDVGTVESYHNSGE